MRDTTRSTGHTLVTPRAPTALDTVHLLQCPLRPSPQISSDLWCCPAHLEWGSPLCSPDSSQTTQPSSGSVSLVRSRIRSFFKSSAAEHFDSDTTRSPRPGEVDGKHYYFVAQGTFRQMIADGAFIEHAQFSNNFYGTSLMTIQNVSSSGRRCILDIESEVSCPKALHPSSAAKPKHGLSRASDRLNRPT